MVLPGSLLVRDSPPYRFIFPLSKEKEWNADGGGDGGGATVTPLQSYVVGRRCSC